MKKILMLVAVSFLAVSSANAKIDLVSAAQKAQDKIDSATADVEAKKQEIADKQAAQKAESEAKAAERKAAVENTKNSLNNLKNAFTK